MREKYESLPLTSLKEIAKARGLKGVSTMKKADIIELMLKKDEQDKAEEAKEREIQMMQMAYNEEQERLQRLEEEWQQQQVIFQEIHGDHYDDEY